MPTIGRFLARDTTHADKRPRLYRPLFFMLARQPAHIDRQHSAEPAVYAFSPLFILASYDFSLTPLLLQKESAICCRYRHTAATATASPRLRTTRPAWLYSTPSRHVPQPRGAP